MNLDPISDDLTHFKKLQKIFISTTIIFKKIAIMHGKGEFAKNNGSICNIPIKTANICNVLPRTADSNKVIVVKLNRDFKYKVFAYFKPVHPNLIYQALNYLKTHNKFYEDISISKVSQPNKLYIFLVLMNIKLLLEAFTKILFQMEQNMVQLRVH